MRMTIANGFQTATATGPGKWEQLKDGMKIAVPVTIGGEACEAIAIIGGGEEREAKARANLVANGWDAAVSWPSAGASIRVNVVSKERNGQSEQTVWITKPGGGGEVVTGDPLAKFLADEKAKLSGVKNDPFSLD
jgi:hypothetical protein